MQLTLLKASHTVFKQENPKAKYEMPEGFNEVRLKTEINKFKEFFKNDQDVYNMCKDFENIASGNHEFSHNF